MRCGGIPRFWSRVEGPDTVLIHLGSQTRFGLLPLNGKEFLGNQKEHPSVVQAV